MIKYLLTSILFFIGIGLLAQPTVTSFQALSDPMCGTGGGFTTTWSETTGPYDITYDVMDPTNTTVVRTFHTESGWTGSPHNVNYTYQPGDDDPSNLVRVRVTVTDANTLAAQLDNSVTIIAGPVITVGASLQGCETTPIVVSGVNVENDNGILWTHDGLGSIQNATTLTPTYNPVAGDVGNTVTLTISADANAPCTSVSDFLTIDITANPTVVAGADVNICQGGIVNLFGSTTNSPSLTWTTSGDGSFSDPISATATYFPGSNDIVTGTATLTLTATSSGACADVTDNLLVSITPAPTIDAGVDTEICEGATLDFSGATSASNVSTVSWSTTGDGSFNTPTAFEPIYTPGPTDVSNGIATLSITATGNGSCSAVSDNMTLTITTAPTVSAGSNEDRCSDEVFDLSSSAVLPNATNFNSLVWSTSGDGFFDDTSALLTTYTPGATDIINGTVDLTLTASGNGSCSAVSDNMTLTIVSAPNAGVYVGTAGEACVTDAAYDLTSLLDGSQDGSGTWTDTDGSGAPISISSADFTGVAPGTYTFTYTVAGVAPCPNASEIVTVNVTEAPNAGTYIGTAGQTCSTETSFDLGALLSGQDAGGTWSDDDLSGATITGDNVDFSGVASGSYNFTYAVIGATCTDDFETVTVNVTQPPNAGTFVGTAGELCIPVSSFDLSSLLDGSQDAGGIWIDSNGSGAIITGNDANFTAVASGSYDFAYTVAGAASCSDASEIVTVNLTEAPNAGTYIGTAGEACSTETSFDLAVLLSGQDAGGTWSDDDLSGATITGDNVDFSGVASGTYNFTYAVIGATCTDDFETVTVNVTLPPNPGIPTDATICSSVGSFDLFNQLTGEDGSGVWLKTGGTGTGEDNTLLESGLVDYTNATGGSYIYTYSETGSGPCPDETVTVTINVETVPNAGIYSGTPGDVCTSEVFDLFSLLDGTEDAGGIWTDPGATGATNLGTATDFTAVPPGTYDFEYTVPSAACGDAVSIVTVNVSQQPSVSANPDIAICQGETLDLTAVSPSFTLSTGVQWTTSGDGSFTPDANSLTPTYNPGPIDVNAGAVNLTITSTGNGSCSASSATVNVDISSTNNAGTYVGTPAQVCLNETAFDFTTLLDGSQDADGTWIDSDASGTTISGDFGDFSGVTAGSYNFEYLVSNGVCADQASSVEVVVNNTPQISIIASIESCGETVLDLSLANPTFSSFASLLWSSSGDGAFNDNTVIEPLYTPGVNDLANGSVTLTVQASGLGDCVDASENILVTFKDGPEITFPANKVFYQENTEIDLNQFSDQIQITGADTYSWNIIAGEGTFAGGASSSTQVYPVYSQNESSYPASIVLQLVATNTTTSCPTTENFEFVIYDNPDYEALIDLYNLNNGASWTDNSNWLSEGTSIGEWSGITVDGNDRVIGIDLPGNGIEDITPLLPTVNNLTLFNISGNRLNFEQLQPFNAVPDFVFGNQDFQYTIPNLIFESLGTDISITVEANAPANTFQWYKNSVQMAGETNQTLNLANAQRSDEGFYYVEISNSNLPDLTLVSSIAEVKISSLERDVIALREFYNSTNGDDWSTIIWDTASDNPTEWSANDQDIIVENNRVVEINLADNNLTGSVPDALNEVRGLRTIDLSNNAIEDLTDLTALPNLVQLDLSANALGFDDLERNISIEGFEFSDQANFGNEPDQRIPQGSDFTLAYDVAGSANVYQWYRNDELVSNEDLSEIAVESITFENMGEYRLEVKNTVVNAVNSEFSLNSNPVNIIATSTISGNVQDANQFATESGRVYPFSVSTTGAYDSVRLENGNFYVDIQTGGFFEIPNIDLGDYVIYVNNNEDSYPDLLNTYYQNTIDWELAEIISLRSDISDLTIIMEGEPQEQTGTSVVSGYLEEEFEEGERQLPRRRVSGVGVSVRRLGGSSRDISFRSIMENNELVAYLETDDNGEFDIPNLQAGRYTIKFDLPGVPMNEESDIVFDFTGEDQEALEIAAVSDEGKITVTRVQYTANKSALSKNIIVYPNPSNGQFWIEGAANVVDIKIMSLEGKVIKELSSFEDNLQGVGIDLSNYPDGMYFMQIQWKDGLNSVNKLIKE